MPEPRSIPATVTAKADHWEHLVLYAPNVGTGGGLVLLRELLSAEWPAQRITAILDRRGKAESEAIPQAIDAIWVTPSLRGRLRAELILRRIGGARHVVFCLHNLPPVFPVAAPVVCLVQNAYLAGLIKTSVLRGRVRLRIAAERFLASIFSRRVRRYVVQTPTMALALRQRLSPKDIPIDVLPFAPAQFVRTRELPKKPGRGAPTSPLKQWDFIYVSDGASHKNHRRLFAAWCILAEQGFAPSLAITLHPQRDAQLRDVVEKLNRSTVRIEDLGQLPHREVLAAYDRAGALIFPSYCESFGNPLIEAQSRGLPIVAAERDYVRDVCIPTETFDPLSPRSIASAVLRFLGRNPGPVTLLTPDEFAAELHRRVGSNLPAGFPADDDATGSRRALPA